MDIKILTEEPANEDLFQGGGHTKSAEAIKRTLEEQPEIRIIGVEGELGGGKSTVINLLKEQLAHENDNFIFIEFDLQQHHNSSIKTALINTIHDGLSESAGDDVKKHKRLELIRDTALGRVLEYTKKTNSELSPYILPFLVSLPFTFKYFENSLRITITTFNQLVGGATYSPTLYATIISLAGYSLFVLLLSLIPINRIFGDKNQKYTEILGSIVKRNSVDTINETLNVSREVSSIDLKKAYVNFLIEAPKDKVIVLVIDNIDRIDANDFQEVWSDLDIIVSNGSENTRIILPYSIAQLTDGLGLKLDKVKEFFSKKIPVSFSAPPLITYDWRNVFRSYFSEAFTDEVGDDLPDKCADLIEIWKSTDSKITPRYLKNHVNKLASKALCIESDELSLLSCSAYLLSISNPKISFRDLITTSYPTKFGDDEVIEPHEISRGKTLTLLDDELGAEKRVRSIMCAHFQARFNIAESEVLISPIKDAIQSIDGEMILELSNIYGFDYYFECALKDVEIQTLPILLAKINTNKTEENRKFIGTWLPTVNKISDNVGLRITLGEEYIEALRTLKEDGITISTQPLDLTLNQIEKSLSNVSGAVGYDGTTNKESFDLTQLYLASSLNKKLPTVIRNPTASLFVYFLWDNKEKFSDWNIEKIKGSQKFRSEVLNCEIKKESKEKANYDSIGRWFLKYYNLGADRPDNKADMLPTSPQELGHITFSGLGSSINTTALVQLTNTSIDNDDSPAECVALLFAHLISNELLSSVINKGGTNVQAWGYIKPILDKYEDYKVMLPNILTLAEKFSSLLTALDNVEHQPYLSNSITKLINENRIHRLGIDEIISSKHYANLKNTYKGTEAQLLSWLSSWSEYIEDNFESWDNTFLVDVIKSANQSFTEILKDQFDHSDHDEDYFKAVIDNPSQNIISIVDLYLSQNWKFRNSSKVGEAIKSTLSNRNDQELTTYSNFNWTDKLISILPANTQKSIVRIYESRLLAQTTSIIEKLCIIQNFHNWISLEVNSKETENNMILILEESKDDVVVTWLDNQDYSFEKWASSSIKDLKQILADKEEYPNINKKLREGNNIDN